MSFKPSSMNPVTMVGTLVLAITGFWVLIGTGIQQHYNPGKGSITSNKDVGYFLGVEIGRMGRAAGNVFFASDLTQKGAIDSLEPQPDGSFCYPWDTKCKGEMEKANQQERIRERRNSY